MRRWILVIDDDKLSGVPREIVHVRTAKAALARLRDRRFWDEVWFDHDLGRGGDVMEVVKFLEDGQVDGTAPSIEQIFVHSMNPVGAEVVYKALKPLYPTRRVPLPFQREHV